MARRNAQTDDALYAMWGLINRTVLRPKRRKEFHDALTAIRTAVMADAERIETMSAKIAEFIEGESDAT